MCDMKKMIKSFQNMIETLNRGGSLYIRCAGKVGRNLAEDLKELGYPVKAFLDNNYSRIAEVCGIPVYSPSFVYNQKKESYYILVAIENDALYDEIRAEFERNGLEIVKNFADFSAKPDRRMADFLDIRPNFDFRDAMKAMAKGRIREMQEVSPDFRAHVPDMYNIIGNLDVPLTTYCSLKCDYCSHCIPYANPPRNFLFEDVIRDLDTVLAVSYVACVALMGGEPFVYPNLVDFLHAYMNLENKENIGFTRIVTNGTILPKDDFFEVYSQIPNAQIYISNYGEKSRKINELHQKCLDFRIPVYVCPVSKDWIVLGDFRFKRNYSDSQLKHLFAVCGAHYCTQLINGRIYSCAHIPVLNEDGLIPFCDTDFCDIRTGKKELAEKLHSYLYQKSFLQGCRYCDGQHEYSRRISRGA